MLGLDSNVDFAAKWLKIYIILQLLQLLQILQLNGNPEGNVG